MKEKTPSTSPGRHSFQREKYIERQLEKNEPISQDYLKMFDQMIDDAAKKFDSKESQEHSLEWDLLTTDWILSKVRESEIYAQHLYAALCNNSFQQQKVIPILKNRHWACSWRYAGGIIADMRQEGDYIDWYCSGIRGGMDLNEENYTQEQRERVKILDQNVSESVITAEIAQDLLKLGWKALDTNDD